MIFNLIRGPSLKSVVDMRLLSLNLAFLVIEDVKELVYG